jgi:hypothetical protein
MKFRGHASAVKPKFPRLPLVRFLSGDTTRGLRGRKTESDRGAEQVLLTAASGRLPALAVQILAIPVMGGIASVILLVIPHWMVSATELAFLQGSSAAMIARWFGAAGWQVVLHFVFVPTAALLLSVDLDPNWYLVAFLVLLLVYGGCYRTKVPIYLSSRATVEALLALLPQRKGFSFIDLGCGCGGVLRRLAKARPDGNYHGVEWAPLPFLLGKLRHVLASTGCRIRWDDFREHSLTGYDVVYVYLSPAPMEELWRKARKEMLPGSIFVSNTFAVPGVAPEAVVRVDDVDGGELLVWRM